MMVCMLDLSRILSVLKSVSGRRDVRLLECDEIDLLTAADYPQC